MTRVSHGRSNDGDAALQGIQTFVGADVPGAWSFEEVAKGAGSQRDGGRSAVHRGGAVRAVRRLGASQVKKEAVCTTHVSSEHIRRTPDLYQTRVTLVDAHHAP